MNINKLFLTFILVAFSVSAYTQTVKINEIMYNFGYNLDKLEAGNWVELYNNSNTAVNLKDWQIKFGTKSYDAPNYILEANEYVVVTSKDSLMLANYPSLSSKLLGDTILGGLDDNSELIQILNNTGTVVDSLTYFDSAPWPECADGKAQSLELKSVGLNNNNTANWACSGVMGGTPGLPNTTGVCATPPKIIINEINYKSDSLNNASDWVEFYNASGATVDLSNWVLYDTDSLFIFPQGTTIAASSYLVVTSSVAKLVSVHPDIEAGTYVDVASFMTLSGGGESITLADNNNCKVHRMKYNNSAPWPPSADGGGATLSLINESYNNKIAGSWAPSTAGGASFGTPGQPNNIPDPCSGTPVTNLVINEINYNSLSTENPSNWIELYNAGSSAVDLSGYRVNNEGEQFIIPSGNTLAPGGYILLADSAQQFKFKIECPNMALFDGDTELNFSNNGELVSVYNFKTVDYGCLVDSVKFNDKAPWPIQADGGGYTLELLNPNLDNTNPANWAASNYILGSPGLENQQTAPTICGCDYDYKRYPLNQPFGGTNIVFANDSIDFAAANIFFVQGANQKFYAGKSIEISSTCDFSVGTNTNVLLDIKPCQ